MDRKTMMIWVPVALVAVGIVVLLFLSGMPYGEHRRAAQPPGRQTPQFDVVAEREASTTTIAEVRAPGEVAPPPAPPRVAVPAAEITESQAMDVLRNYVRSRPDYGVSGDCLVISSQGYINRGFTMNVYDRCGESSLGMWRVDSVTLEVFRRQGDGRYLRP